jgi:hypothetical protein
LYIKTAVFAWKIWYNATLEMKALRFRVKLAVFILAGFILWTYGPGWTNTLKRRYVYSLIGYQLKKFADRRWGASLVINRMKGNAITGLTLQGVVLKGMKGYPPDLRLECDAMRITCRPFGLLFRDFNAEFQKPRLVYCGQTIPLSMQRYAATLVTTFDHKGLDLAGLKGLVRPGLALDGKADVSGLIISRSGRLPYMDIRLSSPDCRAVIGQLAGVCGMVEAGLKGYKDRLQIKGEVRIQRLWLPEGLSGISQLKNSNVLFSNEFFHNSALDIKITAREAFVVGGELQAKVSSELAMVKPKGAKNASIEGDIDLLGGKYETYNHVFEIKKGYLVFKPDQPGPAINIEAQTKVRRYYILARIRGVFPQSRLELSSQPQLSSLEIVSLLLFDKNIAVLSDFEQTRLRSADLNNVLIGDIFLGQAEVALAESVGLDDISVRLNTGRQGQGPAPLLEVGKYLGGDRLYGVYSVKPAQSPTSAAATEQAVSGELAVTDNLTVKGERRWQDSWSLPAENKVSVEFKWKF